ncbi:hypothetical protein KJ940_22175, partial [Myxococcota bacterium]|nr:hypothetical protein [Myxococcota bacterium]
GMPPRPPARLAARLVLQRGERRHVEDGLLLDLGGHRELWLTDLTGEGEDARAQTEALLSSLVVQARALGFEPFEHLLRTWIYVHDIDAHYAGMVQGRARIYEALGFKEQARFPASTGIGGDPVEPGRWVTVNALLADHPPEALRRVHAPDHLPAASSYGVAFDRALSVEDAEKRAVHISGTASIDPEGQILYDDAQAQATRTLENITALLKDADAPVAGLVWLIVYLRDLREAARVEAALAAAGWGATPKLIVQGPVCRPGWLVEIEGLAWIKREEDR